jgi:type I restriction enzyme, S subunit
MSLANAGRTHWEPYPLWSLYRRRERRGKGDAELLSVYRDHGVVPKVSRTDNYNKPSEDLSAYKYVRPGDLVLNKMKTWQGSLAVSSHEGIVSPAYFVAEPVTGVDSRFMHHLLRSKPLIAEYRARSKGIRPSQWDLPWADFSRIKVAIPPANEQRAIADFLDTETTRIDTLIYKKQQLAGAIQQRLYVDLSETVTGRRGTPPLRESCVDWLGPIPPHWTVERLKFVARMESGHTPSRTNPDLWLNPSVPWITLNDVGRIREVEFLDETVNRISEAGLAASSARILPTGTVVLSRDATIGRTAIMAKPMATSQHFANWVCGERLRPRYLWLVFETIMQSYFDSLTAGSTLRTIGMPHLGGFVVPVPPLSEQDAIVSRAAKLRHQASQLSAGLRRQVELLREHRQALITAAVTGEFEVPEVAA